MKRYADAKETVPPPCTILGVELRPFCLGHHLLFKSLGLPFAGDDDAGFTYDEMMLGIAVCGLSYEETVAAIHNGTWPNTIARWRKAAAGPWWKRRELDLEGAAFMFREYLADGYRMPPLWRRPGDKGITMSAPWESLLKCRLVSAGFTESEALNGYMPGRWYDYFTVAELQASERCEDLKSWKKVFFTSDDAERLSE